VLARDSWSSRSLGRRLAATLAAAAVLVAMAGVPAVAAANDALPTPGSETVPHRSAPRHRTARKPAAHSAASPGVVAHGTAGGADPAPTTTPDQASSSAPAPAILAPDSTPSGVQARGGDLVDATTGQRLWSSELDVARPMGSITKVMTALLVIRAGHLNQPIKVTKAALRYVRRDGASSAGLVAGDVLTARQLLEAMLLPSGCDAAYLLATTYGPGRKVFIARMNQVAQTLGMTATHFTGFDGMPFPTERSTYSSPADLVLLAAAAMRYPVFRNIVAQRRHILAKTKHHHRYVWYSTNQMLWYYHGMLGIKTGDTAAAGNCLLFEARRGSQTLIGVTLHGNPSDSASSFFVPAERLLDWGFRWLHANDAFTGRLQTGNG
jgi:serine-type D-Ala-D-Ala carboxypeptidase (penicillin-binding protein 5/6)